MHASWRTRGQDYHRRMFAEGRAALRLVFALGALGCAGQKSISSGYPLSEASSDRSSSHSTSSDDLAAAFDAPSAPSGSSEQNFSPRASHPSPRTQGGLANEMVEALELRYQQAISSKDFDLAAEVAQRWLLSCGPEMTDACRKRALSALSRAARHSAKAQAQDQLARIQASDACVRKAEGRAKSGEKFPQCADAALALYQELGDRLMIARLLSAKGRCFAADPRQRQEAAQVFKQADQACDEHRCLEVRIRALRSLYTLHIRLGEVDLAARAALAEMGLAAQKLPSDRRAYARTAEVDKACEALDRRDGLGSCRRLEKSMLGTYAFHDFSEQASTREGLSAEDVRQVGQHFHVLIQDCLAEEAERLEPPASVTFRLHWMVLHDGRVDQVVFDRRDQSQGPFAECIRRQFALWRYPRYPGEFQHVDQAFSINTRERRIAADSMR